MGYWKGLIICEEKTINAIIQYVIPTSTRPGNWSGIGLTKDHWELGEYQTNIGTIIVTNFIFHCDDDSSRIIFSGSEIPEGNLLEEFKKNGYQEKEE